MSSPRRPLSASRRLSLRTGASAALLALAAIGCSPAPDPAADVAPEASACKRVAQACRLGPGRLGVCEPTDDPARPFRCSSQH